LAGAIGENISGAQAIRVFIGLGFLIGIYLLPYWVLASALIRLVFQWHTSRGQIQVAAGLAALAILLLQVDGADILSNVMFYSGFASGLAGLVFLLRASINAPSAAFWVDVAAIVGVLVFKLSGVNWIVG